VPADAFEQLFDRERLLGGLPARRANTLLFLIESRTARLAARSRQAMQRFVTREASQARELSYLEAFALGREPPRRPTVQDLERHAPQWAALVARNPRVQAALAARLSEKHRLARRRVPGIRAALGLDDPRVAAAYEALYQQPLESIYVERSTWRERARWASAATGARLEGLSPFWTAYALTLTETVGSTIVALPIAVAAIGPLPAVAILVALGLVNVLTVAYMADALTRTRTIRFGDAYIGRVVTALLGRPGAVLLTVGLLAICLLGMQADYIGVSTTLESAFGVPAVAWVVLLFVAELWYLRRGSIDATVTSALVVGALNIALILIISALALVHVDPPNLSHVELPFVGGRGSDVSSLALVFGVTFTAYFGHLSVSNCARVVLGRDPSGRALVRGVVGAQLTAIALYVVFVVAVTGAVTPAVLAGEDGTALAPLADQAGPVVLALGGILVVLGMGMASIHSALALFYLVRERLPSRAPLALVLPRRSARLLLVARRRSDATSVAITYLGLAGSAPRFRLDVVCDGQTRRVEATAPAQWEPFAEPALRDLGERGLELRVSVLAANDHELRAELSTSMRLRYEGEWDTAGVGLAAILALSDDEAQALAWIMRQPDASAAEVAAASGVTADVSAALLAPLVEQGLLAERSRGGERRYVARAGWRRGGRLSADIWEALGDDDAQPRDAVVATRTSRLFTGDRSRFLAGIAPVAAVFAAAIWQASSGAVSLAGVLSVLGVIVVALLAGVFPVLLNVAARHKGELLGWGYRVPTQRWVLGAVYAFALGGVALHGLVIWDDAPRRIAALAVTAITVAVTASMIRAGAFRRRATIELRHDAHDDSARFAVVSAGRPTQAEVVLRYDDGEQRVRGASGEIARFSALRSIAFSADWDAGALQIWAHTVSDEEESAPLGLRLEAGAGPVSLDVDGAAIVAPAPQVTLIRED
jgi:amino acid permease